MVLINKGIFPGKMQMRQKAATEKREEQQDETAYSLVMQKSIIRNTSPWTALWMLHNSPAPCAQEVMVEYWKSDWKTEVASCSFL